MRSGCYNPSMTSTLLSYPSHHPLPWTSDVYVSFSVGSNAHESRRRWMGMILLQIVLSPTVALALEDKRRSDMTSREGRPWTRMDPWEFLLSREWVRSTFGWWDSADATNVETMPTRSRSRTAKRTPSVREVRRRMEDPSESFFQSIREEVEIHSPPGGWTRDGLVKTVELALEGIEDEGIRQSVRKNVEEWSLETCRRLGVDVEEADEGLRQIEKLPAFYLERGYADAHQALTPRDLKSLSQHQDLLFARIPPDRTLFEKFIESQRPIGIPELGNISRMASAFLNIQADNRTYVLHVFLEECRLYMSTTLKEGNVEDQKAELIQLEKLMVAVSISLQVGRCSMAQIHAAKHWPVSSSAILKSSSIVVKEPRDMEKLMAHFVVSLCELHFYCSSNCQSDVCSAIAPLIPGIEEELKALMLEETLPLCCDLSHQSEIWMCLYQAMNSISSMSKGFIEVDSNRPQNHLRFLQDLRTVRKASGLLKASGYSLQSVEALSKACTSSVPAGFADVLANSFPGQAPSEDEICSFLVYIATEAQLKQLATSLELRLGGFDHGMHATVLPQVQEDTSSEEDEMEFYVDKSPAGAHHSNI